MLPDLVQEDLFDGIAAGIQERFQNYGVDFIDGLKNMSSLETAIPPIMLYNLLRNSGNLVNVVKDSFNNNVINGDTKSRTSWSVYALLTIADTAFRSHGAGNAPKVAKWGNKGASANLTNAVQQIEKWKSIIGDPKFSGNNVLNKTKLQNDFLKPTQLMTQGKYFNNTNYYVPYSGESVDKVLYAAKLKEEIKVIGKGIDNPTTRLPRTNGKWDGEPGNGKWYSDKPEVKNITNGDGVEFINGRPNFSPWSEGDIVFEKGKLTGTQNDFSLVYEQIQHQYNLSSKNTKKKLLKQAGVTPHHKSSSVIELMPTDLHGNIPHIGSASDLRRGY